MRGRRAVEVLLPAIGVALLLSSCGGGSAQDAKEPRGTFAMKVLSATFPGKQAVARPAQMKLRVKNTGAHRVPNVAVTVDSFSYSSKYPEEASAKQPIWVIEQGPGAVAKPPVQSESVSAQGGGQTAYVNTWALGPLAPGATRTFSWQVVPVKSGRYTVHFTVAAGLAGRALARLGSGGPVRGALTAQIAGTPPATHVDPATGKVVPGALPSIGAP